MAEILPMKGLKSPAMAAVAALTASLFACQPSGQADGSPGPAMDTVIHEIRDTIITFDPATYEESVRVVVSYDTTVTPHAGSGQ